jgi:hypothetical protein
VVTAIVPLGPAPVYSTRVARRGPMGRHLFTVTEVFTVKGRGICLCPGLSLSDYRAMKPGDEVELRAPGSPARRVTIQALVYPPSVIYVDKVPPERTSFVMLPPGLQAADVPAGTEVWLPPA